MKTGPGRHGTNRRGKGSNNRQEGEPTTAKQTRQTQRGPNTHRKEHGNHREPPAVAQAETPTQQNHKHREAKPEEKQNETRDKGRQREYGPNQSRTRKTTKT